MTSLVAITRFVEESNRIENITRAPLGFELEAHKVLWALSAVTVEHLEEFVGMVAAAPLRRRPRMDVRVGGHHPPRGGLSIEPCLKDLLREINEGHVTPYKAHVRYETLHPFMDGNGRSGRALWAWQMLRDGLDPFKLGFLWSFYYQSLSGGRQ